MKKFLQKLGSRKFWALVATVITSCMILFGYSEDVTLKVVALVTNVGAVIVYLLVEGSIDKEAQKQNVYIMPGSATTPPEDGPLMAAPADAAALTPEQIWDRVKVVHQELNQYLQELNQGKETDAAQEAIARYLRIYDFLNAKGPIATGLAAPEKGRPSNATA